MGGKAKKSPRINTEYSMKGVDWRILGIEAWTNTTRT